MPTIRSYPASVDELKKELIELSPEDFVHQHVLDRVPAVFDDHISFARWRYELAAGLEIDPLSIVVVGSSCLGFSLSPKKNYSAFHSDSDIDVAVVSSHHFDLAWRWLRGLGHEDLIPRRRERQIRKRHRRNLVFNGTIATDDILEFLPFAEPWQGALDGAASRAPTAGRTVKARIYRDFLSLREYQVQNVMELKKLLEAGVDEIENESAPIESSDDEDALIEELLAEAEEK